jgi:hypothetical protein
MEVQPMHTRQLLSILGSVGLIATGASSLAMPAPQSSGGVQYVTGGIGVEESSEMQAAAPQWPLSLEFAVQTADRAQWLADVDVRVTDRRGHEVLHALADGPLLLARLAPGDYTVHASAGGTSFDRRVHIAPGRHARAVFVWPAGTGVAAR